MRMDLVLPQEARGLYKKGISVCPVPQRLLCVPACAHPCPVPSLPLWPLLFVGGGHMDLDGASSCPLAWLCPRTPGGPEALGYPDVRVEGKWLLQQAPCQSPLSTSIHPLRGHTAPAPLALDLSQEAQVCPTDFSSLRDGRGQPGRGASWKN